MALLWSKQSGGTLYELRSAGRSRRLYTDGVFHSQYNPSQPLTGHVWDLLMLPAFFYPPNKIRRVLVLGVGGGAVIHMLQRFTGPENIVGVELNPIHISIARRFFNLRYPGLEIIEADAVQWLKQYRGEKFDMIIDDLFSEQDGEPVSVIKAGPGWFGLMLKHLQRDGLIVRNFINRQELQESAGLKNTRVAGRFASVFQLTSCFNENFVAAYLRTPASSAALRKRLMEVPELNPRLKSSRLRYRIRKLA